METKTLIAQFSEEEVQEMIVKSVQKVFRTMLGREITFCKDWSYTQLNQPVSNPLNTDDLTVVASIGFVGSITGTVYLYFPVTLALQVASGMLGMSSKLVEQEGAETVNDAVGEIANMTVGTFKNQLCDQGYDCSLTLPSILRGNHFCVEPSWPDKVVRRFYRFESEGLPHIFELLIKAEE